MAPKLWNNSRTHCEMSSSEASLGDICSVFLSEELKCISHPDVTARGAKKSKFLSTVFERSWIRKTVPRKRLVVKGAGPGLAGLKSSNTHYHTGPREPAARLSALP